MPSLRAWLLRAIEQFNAGSCRRIARQMKWRFEQARPVDQAVIYHIRGGLVREDFATVASHLPVDWIVVPVSNGATITTAVVGTNVAAVWNLVHICSQRLAGGHISARMLLALEALRQQLQIDHGVQLWLKSPAQNKHRER